MQLLVYGFVRAAHHVARAYDIYIYIYIYMTHLAMFLANRLDGIKRGKLRLLFKVGQLCEVHDKEQDDWILACVQINCVPSDNI